MSTEYSGSIFIPLFFFFPLKHRVCSLSLWSFLQDTLDKVQWPVLMWLISVQLQAWDEARTSQEHQTWDLLLLLQPTVYIMANFVSYYTGFTFYKYAVHMISLLWGYLINNTLLNCWTSRDVGAVCNRHDSSPWWFWHLTSLKCLRIEKCNIS